ncbi:MAG: YcaO-like family protein [Bdellovibrionales bacterium]|nr:YcaO-like family protein [Bdellovibrionales bacterium]
MAGNRIFDARFIEGLLKRLSTTSSTGVSFHENEVPASFGSLPHCFHLNVELWGTKLSSWGTAEDRDEAAAKCVAELVERICGSHSYPILYRPVSGWFARERTLHEIRAMYPASKNWTGSTSSGVAIHSDLKSAIDAALRELVERHTILKALALRIAPYESSSPKILDRYKIPEQVTLRFLVWRGAFGLFVCACQIGVGGGAYYAFGTASSLEVAKERAFLEGSGMVAYVPHEPKADDPTIHPGSLESFMKFHRYSKDKTTLEFLSRVSAEISEIDVDLARDDFFYSECPAPAFLGDTKPLVCVRVVSPKVQPLFFDNWSQELLNPAAISLEGHDVPRAPHIIS